MDLYRLMYVGVFILLFVLLPCECEERVNLTAVVGSSVTFPDPVKEKGYFILKQKAIASVYNGFFEIDEDVYSNRLSWSSSGQFILSDLQKSDSGFYGIDSKKGTVFNKLFELKVYDPVSAPDVSCLNRSESSHSVQCSVNKTEQTTLSWFREEQPVNSSRSGVLPLTVQQQDYTFIYRCVSENPADTKTTTVNITTVCEKDESQSKEKALGIPNLQYILYIFIATVIIIALLAVLFVIYKKRRSQNKSFQTQDSVQYAQINHRKRKDDQPLNASGSPAHPNLTTVYDKIQSERMIPTYSNSGEMT